ncbi:hypothetical protein SGLAM104S_01626 [Streptomyces glaucescens]
MATPTIPRNADELAEMLADPKRIKDVVASADDLKNFITAYSERQQGDGTDLNRLVAEETQKQLADFLREHGQDTGQVKRLNLDPQNGRAGRANMLTSHRQGTAHNAAAPGAVVDQLFADGIDYVRNIWHKNTKADAGKLAELRNAASSVSPADGGFPGAGGTPQPAAGDRAGDVRGPAAGDRRSDGQRAGALPDDRQHDQPRQRVRWHGHLLG